jgi:hypothetical protein
MINMLMALIDKEENVKTDENINREKNHRKNIKQMLEIKNTVTETKML